MSRVDAAVKAGEHPPAFVVTADEPRHAGASSERRDVVRRVSGSARQNLRRVVLQDEHGRFTRDPGDLAIDELVRDEIADDEHAPAREAVDELQEPFFTLGLAGQRMN